MEKRKPYFSRMFFIRQFNSIRDEFIMTFTTLKEPTPRGFFPLHSCSR